MTSRFKDIERFHTTVRSVNEAESKTAKNNIIIAESNAPHTGTQSNGSSEQQHSKLFSKIDQQSQLRKWFLPKKIVLIFSTFYVILNNLKKKSEKISKSPKKN